MKVLKQGTVKKDTKVKTCTNCKTKIEYTRDDVEQDRDGRFIVCPSCARFLSV